MSAEHVQRTENLINSGDRRMPEQKYAGQSENRYRRKRRYGWHVFQLLLVLWIPSLPVVSHWFGTSLWIPAGYWALTLFAVYQLLPQIHVPGSLRQQMAVQGYVWSGAGIYLAIRYGMGVVLKSLAASPYDHSPLGLAGNAVETFLSLAFREYTRAYGIGTIYRLRKRRGVVASLFRVCFTLLLALTEIPLNRALLVQDGKSLFFFLVQQVFPAIANSAAAFQSGILRRMAGRTDLQRGAGAVPTRIPVSAPASVAGGECCEGGLSGSVCVVAPGQMCNGTWNEPGQRTKHAGRSVPFLCRSGGSGSVLLVLCRRVSSLPFGGADRKHGTGHLPRGCGADP